MSEFPREHICVSHRGAGPGASWAGVSGQQPRLLSVEAHRHTPGLRFTPGLRRSSALSAADMAQACVRFKCKCPRPPKTEREVGVTWGPSSALATTGGPGLLSCHPRSDRCPHHTARPQAAPQGQAACSGSRLPLAQGVLT